MESRIHDPEVGTTRVWLVEDNAAFRSNLEYIINKYTGLRCPKALPDIKSLKSSLDQLPASELPDIILLDIELPGQGGIEAVPWLLKHFPEVPVVMLTIHDDEGKIREALQAGARGYLLKAMPLDDMVEGIRQAAKSGMLLSPSVTESVLQAFHPNPPLDSYNLTPRQFEVLRCLWRGYSRKEIAEELFISPHTVSKHQQEIYSKMGVNSAREAIALSFPLLKY